MFTRGATQSHAPSNPISDKNFHLPLFYFFIYIYTINPMIMKTLRYFYHPNLTPYAYFDGRQNFSQIQSTWNQLNAKINGIIADIGSVNIKIGGYDVVALGKELHTVADFYAHSNYVDLYVGYYKSNNNGNMPTTIPTYEEGLQDAGFKEILKSNLRTGDFNLFDNEKTNPNGARAQSPTSHNKMNKDNINTPLGKLAKNVAIKHTTQIFNQLKNKLDD